ncbi:hypothetical protein [Acrocarpospora phusangensis]|nr:hypothetical protein [Acrocarpospora phusangensis]
MSLKRLRRRIEARVGGLPLPVPFDVRMLSERVAEQRGRPIRLLPMTGHWGLWGLWVSVDTADMIFYEEATTPPHQDHIILHELCHILCDHYPTPLAPAEHARLLLPDLDPEMVRRVLGRTAYSVVEEQEAELMASLIWQRARHPAAPTATGVLVERLHAALDWPGAGGDRG